MKCIFKKKSWNNKKVKLIHIFPIFSLFHCSYVFVIHYKKNNNAMLFVDAPHTSELVTHNSVRRRGLNLTGRRQVNSLGTAVVKTGIHHTWFKALRRESFLLLWTITLLNRQCGESSTKEQFSSNQVFLAECVSEIHVSRRVEDLHASKININIYFSFFHFTFEKVFLNIFFYINVLYQFSIFISRKFRILY